MCRVAAAARLPALPRRALGITTLASRARAAAADGVRYGGAGIRARPDGFSRSAEPGRRCMGAAERRQRISGRRPRDRRCDRRVRTAIDALPRGEGAEREQIKWLAIPVLALVIALVVTVIDLARGGSGGGAAVSSLYAVVQLLLPVCMAIAILRYRLYDIDVLINRALVYGATTAGIAVAFFGGIVVLQAILRPITSGSELAVAVSTLVSFALFQPLRRRVQEIVDRRFYRSRYDAVRTLDTFSVRLRVEVDLDAVLHCIMVAACG